MAQRLQPMRSGPRRSGLWRSGADERQWLSVLIDTMEAIAQPEVRARPHDPLLLAAMEEASRPEFRAKRCDRELLDSLTSHLARPASSRGLYRYSNFSLRN